MSDDVACIEYGASLMGPEYAQWALWQSGFYWRFTYLPLWLAYARRT